MVEASVPTGPMKAWHYYLCSRFQHERKIGPHDILVVYVEDKIGYGFLVTTDHTGINDRGLQIQFTEWVTRRPELLCCQVRLPRSSQKFLKHDSFLGCHEIFQIEAENVQKDREENPSPKIVDDIRVAVEQCNKEPHDDSLDLDEYELATIRTSAEDFLKR